MSRRLVITGADGFVGWHLRCRLRALSDDHVTALSHDDLSDPRVSAEALVGAKVVFHLAGVNRGNDEQVTVGNVNAARHLIEACRAVGATPHVVYANSIHAGNDTSYGRSKQQAADILSKWTDGNNRTLSDIRLPNLFGEHGRPFYNSVVATFCHLLASGSTPTVSSDAELPLLHVQRAAAVLMEAASTPSAGRLAPTLGKLTRVAALHDLLVAQAARYATGELPDLSDPFQRDLFNTYRSYTFPQSFPLPIAGHTDDRGSLYECVRAAGGPGQTFVSTTRPGITRGEHFHLNKVERFVVIAGTGQIRLRKLFTNEVVSFDVVGASPQIVDMPTMWAHSITNTGLNALVTLFWTDELFNADRPDTYAEPVLQVVGVS